MLPQQGLRMIELISVVTYAWPVETSAGGCSETLPLGTIQETFGRPQFARFVHGRVEVGQRLDVAELAVLLDINEVGKRVPDARRLGALLTGAQVIASSASQSGSLPSKT